MFHLKSLELCVFDPVFKYMTCAIARQSLVFSAELVVLHSAHPQFCAAPPSSGRKRETPRRH